MKSERAFGLIWVRYLFGVLYSYLIASVEVIAILRLIAGPRVHVAVALVVSVAGGIVGAAVMAATLASTLGWYRRGETRRNTSARAHRCCRFAMRVCTALSGWRWVSACWPCITTPGCRSCV